MKKIVMGIAALACAASMFAVDISSTMKMNATIAGKAGDDVEFFKVNSQDQKDDDALIFSANTEKSGANFQFWYNYDATDNANAINFRKVSLWFKPLDTLKVTIGDVKLEPAYKEHIFWWHGVYGEQPGTWGAFGGEYIAGAGVKAEFNPIANLGLTFAFMPGINKPWLATTKDFKVENFGITAKYSNVADMPLSIAGAFAYCNEGKKIIGIGADYGNEWGAGFYGFLNVNINLNKDGLYAISFDNSEKFVMDALTLQAHLPVSIFKAGDDMKLGMHATVKATYAMDGFSPYILISNEPDGDNAGSWIFDDTFAFSMTFKPGVTFNVGTCGFDVAARIDVAEVADETEVKWAIPVEMKIGL